MVEELHLQDLYDLNKAVLALDIISNAEVQRCCIMLDDREGHGFLAADVLGVELVRRSFAPSLTRILFYDQNRSEILVSRRRLADGTPHLVGHCKIPMSSPQLS